MRSDCSDRFVAGNRARLQRDDDRVRIGGPEALDGTPIVWMARIPARTRLFARSVAPVKSSAMQPRKSLPHRLPRGQAAFGSGTLGALFAIRARATTLVRVAATAEGLGLIGHSVDSSAAHCVTSGASSRTRLSVIRGRRARDAHRANGRFVATGSNRGGYRRDAGLGFVERQAVASLGGRPKLLQERVDRSNDVGSVSIGVAEATLRSDVLDGFVRLERGEPCLAGRRREQRHGARGLRRLVQESARGALRVRDPYERTAVDNRETSKLAALVREPVEDRLANVRKAGSDVEALAEDGEAHRESIEARLPVLLGPAQVDQRRKQAMRAALRQVEPVRDVAERHFARAVGEELDDSETTLCGYVGHGYARREERHERVGLAGEHVASAHMPAAVPHRVPDDRRRRPRDTTTSPTSVSGASAPISPGMPSDFAHADGRCVHDHVGVTRDGGSRFDAAAGKRVAKRARERSARSVCGSMIASDATPAAASSQAMALPAPPAPNSATRRPRSTSPFCSAPRTKPAPSNMSPVHVPSVSRRSAFNAPTRLAVGPSRVAKRHGASLVGHRHEDPVEIFQCHQRRHRGIESLGQYVHRDHDGVHPRCREQLAYSSGDFTCTIGSPTIA